MEQLEESARALMAQSTVRISTSRDSGTGFWIGPKTILTCSHVVTDENNRALQNITVEWRQDGQFKKLAATADIARTNGVDLALLTVVDPPPIHPCAFLLNKTLTGSELTSYGYPSIRPDGDQVTFRMEGASFVDGHALLKFKEGQVDFGASGSPVLHDRYRSVCALLTISRNVNIDLGGYATQVDLAFREWPALQDIQSEARTYHRAWNDLLPHTCLYRSQKEEQQRLIREELDQRIALKPHPLSPRFLAFIKARSWHDMIAARFEDLRRAAFSVKEWLSELPEIAGLDYTSNYDQILNFMQPVVEGPFREHIEAAVSDLESRLNARMKPSASSSSPSDTDELKTKLRDVRDIQRMLRDMDEEMHEPAFGKCLLVLGEMGSGKTHFLSGLLGGNLQIGQNPGGEPDPLVIVVRPRQLGNQSILGYLLGTLRERTKVNWESFEEFDRYLCSVPNSPKLLVAIDDLHTVPDSIGFLDQLKRSISENTQYHTLYWIITLEHQSYIQISSASRFWNEYGYVDPDQKSDSDIGDTTQLGPWIQLDELNLQNRTGLNIVASNLPRDSSQAFNKLASAKVFADDLRLLIATPFIAWTLVECSDLLSETMLINLNYAQFLKRYWETVVPRLSADQKAQQRLQTAVGLITSFLIDKGFEPPAEQELVNFVAERAKGKSDLSEGGNSRDSIELLERSRILCIFEAKDPELDLVRKVDLCFEAFWNWKLGQRLNYEFDRAKKGGSITFLESWFRKRVGDHPSAIGILEFFLLGQNVKQKEEIWDAAAGSARLPTGAVWFAAAKLSLPDRAVVAKRLLRPGLKLRDDHHDLYGMIYFVSSLSGFIPEGIAIPDIFHALKPHYAALNGAALGDYFVFTVERFLPKIGGLKYLPGMMLELDGCEVMGVAEQVANLTIEAMILFEEDLAHSIDLVMQYLSLSPDIQVRKGLDEEDRSTYQHWLIAFFCKALVNQHGITAFSELSRRGWYAETYSKIPRAVGRRIKKEANFAFGDWYRSMFPAPIEDYLVLVDRAARSGNAAEREAAFFMIRHTRATHRGNVPVDAKFRPTLHRLMSDPSLGWITSKYLEFFQINKVQPGLM